MRPWFEVGSKAVLLETSWFPEQVVVILSRTVPVLLLLGLRGGVSYFRYRLWTCLWFQSLCGFVVGKGSRGSCWEAQGPCRADVHGLEEMEVLADSAWISLAFCKFSVSRVDFKACRVKVLNIEKCLLHTIFCSCFVCIEYLYWIISIDCPIPGRDIFSNQ